MGKRFDKQQLEAIETLGTNVLVSASAGAGKTGVLVERLTKRTVRDKVSISRIVAMTFTQAAAEEMKKRLAGRLNMPQQRQKKSGCSLPDSLQVFPAQISQPSTPTA